MRVSLFITCLADVFYPDVGKSAVKVLERCGVTVDFPPGQTCCGQPAYNSGYHPEAREAARHMIRAFSSSQYVVAPSGSCAAMVRHYYPELFRDDPEWSERARELAAKTYELSEFLVNVLGVTDVGASYSGMAAYHPSCHLKRGLGVRDEPLTLLSNVRGLSLAELPHSDDCCGFGGTFSLKMGEISQAMVDEKVQQIEATGADLLVGCDLGCLMNIGGRLRRAGKQVQVRHLAEVLAGGDET